MGQDEDRLRLLDAARGLMARGGDKFSITSVCAEAGVERSVFKAHFAGKAALLAALLNPFPEPDKKFQSFPRKTRRRRKSRVFPHPTPGLSAACGSSSAR